MGVIIKLFSEVYNIETPTTLIIGDPSYFEELNDRNIKQKIKNNIKKSIFVKGNIDKDLKARLIFSKLAMDDFLIYEAKVVVVIEEYLDTYCKEMYYPVHLIEDSDLGVDTAKYNIITSYGDNIRSETIDYGSDGYIGQKMILNIQDKECFVVSFTFQNDLMAEKEIRDTLSYLFNCNEIKENRK